MLTSEKHRLKAYDTEQQKWIKGYGFHEIGYTEEYLQSKGITGKKACVYTDYSPVEVDLASVSPLVAIVMFEDGQRKPLYMGDIVKRKVEESEEPCFCVTYDLPRGAVVLEDTQTGKKKPLFQMLLNQTVTWQFIGHRYEQR